MKLSYVFLFFSAIVLSVSSAYRILAVLPLPSKSHFIVIDSVLKTLAKRGHQVDVVSHYPQKNQVKNYKTIVSLQGLVSSKENHHTVEDVSKMRGFENLVYVLGNLRGNQICNLMGHDKFQELLKKPPTDPPYDLVITEAFGANCYMGLGYVFNVPVVAISSNPEFPWTSNFIGNAENYAVFPNLLLQSAGKKLTFWERLKNVYIDVSAVRIFHAITEEPQTASMRKYLKPDIPNIREVEKNVALVLVNTHPILNGVKPVTGSLIQIAGLHVEANDEVLPAELKNWMDKSTHGVVYFSLGSMVLIESLPVKQLKEIYDVFEKISPVRVIMKVTDSTKLPPGLPENVKTMSWLPQQPLLAHPNMKVFITHGGLGGTQEALYFGVPMIGLPLFSDQFGNVDALVAKGMAIRLDLRELSKKSLSPALNALLNDSKYKKNAVYYSKLFRDNPMSQSDKAIFWIEYVIRNGGNSLKSPALQYQWYELLLLDVYGFVLLVFLLVFSVVLVILKLLLNKILRKKVDGKRVKKKQT